MPLPKNKVSRYYFEKLNSKIIRSRHYDKFNLNQSYLSSSLYDNKRVFIVDIRDNGDVYLRHDVIDHMFFVRPILAF